MDDIIFGELLGKLLYLSNQKKSSLAKALGYDISYISKWINSKNLPSSKNANTICKDIANFIVESLTESTSDDIVKYFEIDIKENEDTRVYLLNIIEKYLKKSYLSTTGNINKGAILQETYTQERYNSTNYVNPRLRKKFLAEDVIGYVEKNEKLDILICADIFHVPMEDKIALSSSSQELNNIERENNLNIKFLTGFKYDKEDVLINAMVILNMVSSYYKMNFEMYNCDVAHSTGAFIVKNKLSYFGVFRPDGASLLTNISKEKEAVNEFYYSVESLLKSQGNLIYNKKSSIDIIKDTTYMQYIMGHDPRWLIGNINELFMPEDLFLEIAESIFGHDEDIMNKLKKINIFLHNLTYKSELKVLIYQSEINKYISSGELSFFNIPVTLNFKQREKHIRHLEKILKESNDIEIRIIDGKIVEDFKNEENASMFLSKDMKMIKMNIQKEKHQYAIAIDDDFKNMCDDLFDAMWEMEEDLICKDKLYILDRISKVIAYMNIINEKF